MAGVRMVVAVRVEAEREEVAARVQAEGEVGSVLCLERETRERKLPYQMMPPSE
jgi:hypothetical protein